MLNGSGYQDYFCGSVQVETQRAAIFMSDEMRRVLQNCEEIAYDGTFFTCPKQFSQVFTVFVVVQGKTFPCVTVLMTSKTQELYEAVFGKILEIVPDMNPQLAIADFERASYNAMKTIFPNIRVSGCSFHFIQANLRMARKQGLTEAFRTNNELKSLLKRLMHLNFLPAHMMSPAFEILAREDPGLVDPLEKKKWRKVIKYIRSFWMDKIGPEWLSVFGLERKTNNGCEQYHSRLKGRVISHRPRIWKYIEILNEIIVDTNADVHRHVSNIPISRPQRRINFENAQRREVAEQKLNSGK